MSPLREHVDHTTQLPVRQAERSTSRGNPIMKMRPLHDRILVRRIEEKEKTKGGLIIPDTAKEKPQEGKIIAVGDGRINEDGTLRPLDVREGDRVLFSKYSGSEIQSLDQEHLIIREDDVLAVLE
jgi:chaperonin GroES